MQNDPNRLVESLDLVVDGCHRALDERDEPGRADVIVAGVEILLCVMETFDVAEIVVSEKDILDGLVIELLEHSES